VFNINAGELLIIAIVFLLVFGPDRIPEIAIELGRFVRNVRSAIDEATGDLTREFELAAKEARDLEARMKRLEFEERRQDPRPRTGEPEGPAPDPAGSTGESASAETAEGGEDEP
jgi:sec-independent protein translocase protein TatB